MDNLHGEHIDEMQRRAEVTGDKIHALESRGICTHGRRKGPGSPIDRNLQVTCEDCGMTGTWNELDESTHNALSL